MTLVPETVCSMEPYCYTRKVTRCVPVCEPVCEPACPPPGPSSMNMSGTEWFARLMDRMRSNPTVGTADLN